ncbi:MAG TPA: holo-ACP synthase [Crinalium sp.]
MNIRIGTDIVHIPRIKTALDRFGEKFLQRVYTPIEQQDFLKLLSSSRGDADGRGIARLAGRWAAKEAVVKALGTGWRGVRYTDVEIQRQSNGEPHVCLYGSASARAIYWGGCQWQVSLSHDGDYAIATALLYVIPESVDSQS